MNGWLPEHTSESADLGIVQVRDVDPTTLAVLRERARSLGQSLSGYLRDLMARSGTRRGPRAGALTHFAAPIGTTSPPGVAFEACIPSMILGISGEDGCLMSVRHALLALLSEGPKYGLQLRQEFEARTGVVWPLNVGQVYTTVARLERDGLVASDDGEEPGPQKAYRITPAGGEELAAWLRTPPAAEAPPRDELVIKILVAARLPGVDVAQIIQAHRRRLVETMSRFTRLKQDAAEDDLGLLLVADAEIFRLEAFVRWLDAAEARIRHHAHAPAAASATPSPGHSATPTPPNTPSGPARRGPGARATR